MKLLSIVLNISYDRNISIAPQGLMWPGAFLLSSLCRMTQSLSIPAFQPHFLLSVPFSFISETPEQATFPT